MFKPEVKDEINKRLQEFAQVEMGAGNKLTPNSWNYLLVTLEMIFKRNLVEPKKEPE